MNRPSSFGPTTLPAPTVLNRSPLRRVLLLASLALIGFALLPRVQAVNPPPDGDYGNGNTAEGLDALFSLSGGLGNNTAIGTDALFSNTFGGNNTAIGAFSLLDNTNGGGNTATGLSALRHNTLGNGNTATGSFALQNNTTGTDNTAIGDVALLSNTTADFNTATGVGALLNNTTGPSNTATGFQALFNNTTAVGNTASGFRALLSNKTGFNNTADGRQALQNNTTGSFNVALGNLAGHNLTTGSNNIDIGNQGVAAEAKTIRIGEQGNQNRTFIAGIFGSSAPGGVQVFVNSNGRLVTLTSSARFKDNIQPMNNASEAILALKPVTFRYKQVLDPNGIPQFGLVAEEVEKVDPNLVVHDGQGKPYTVRYEAVNAMLLNEFLKEHRRVKEQEGRLQEQEAKIAQQQKQIEALAAGLQKVGAAVELNKPALAQVADTR